MACWGSLTTLHCLSMRFTRESTRCFCSVLSTPPTEPETRVAEHMTRVPRSGISSRREISARVQTRELPPDRPTVCIVDGAEITTRRMYRPLPERRELTRLAGIDALRYLDISSATSHQLDASSNQSRQASAASGSSYLPIVHEVFVGTPTDFPGSCRCICQF
jgi:hypothetical protein